MTKTGWYASNGKTWHGLPPQALRAFMRDLDALIDQHFAKDEDSDYPIQVRVIDRTDTGVLHYGAIPHLHAPRDTPSRLTDALRIANMNVNMASDDLRRIVQDVIDVLGKVK